MRSLKYDLKLAGINYLRSDAANRWPTEQIDINKDIILTNKLLPYPSKRLSLSLIRILPISAQFINQTLGQRGGR